MENNNIIIFSFFVFILIALVVFIVVLIYFIDPSLLGIQPNPSGSTTSGSTPSGSTTSGYSTSEPQANLYQPASEDYYPNPIMIKSKSTNNCMYVNDQNNKVYFGSDCTYTPYQLWDIAEIDDNDYVLKSNWLGRCLKFDGTVGYCDDAARLSPQVNQNYLNFKDKRGRCFNVVNNELRLDNCNNQDNEMFKIQQRSHWGYWYNNLDKDYSPTETDLWNFPNPASTTSSTPASANTPAQDPSRVPREIIYDEEDEPEYTTTTQQPASTTTSTPPPTNSTQSSVSTPTSAPRGSREL
jgi:hypothetical protein